MISSVNPALHQSNQRLVTRRDLVHALQTLYLLDCLLGDLQVVLGNILLHRLHPDLELALMRGQECMHLVGDAVCRAD